MKSHTPEENQGRRHTIRAKVQSPGNTLVTGQYPKGDAIDTGSDERVDTQKPGVAGLAVILGQMVAYLSGRVDVDDMDILSFSLHHLFSRVDYLYHVALPGLLSSTAPAASEPHLKDELSLRQSTWSKLRTIKHTISRMEALCNLLSDATRCILDALDLTSKDVASSKNTLSQPSSLDQRDEEDWLKLLNQEHWDHALRTLTGSLSHWQQSYNQLTPFAGRFAELVPATTLLARLDEVFNTLLDNSRTVFGDILPGFQAISLGDDDAVATLLFDLMQQADQLLLQFDAALEPLQTLIEQFALVSSR